MRYVEHPPPADLRRVVQSIWVVEGDVGESMRVVPDACVDLIALDAGVREILLNGPMPVSEVVRLWLPRIAGLRLVPGTLPRIGGVESLADVRGSSRTVRGPDAGGPPEQQLVVAARRLLAQHRLLRNDAVDAALLSLLRQGGGSHPAGGVRRLQRLFSVHVGLSPQETFAAMRHDAVARSLRRADRAPLATIAAVHGFSDQAHLTHAFRRLAGIPPGRYGAEVAGDVFVQDPHGSERGSWSS